jgi:peptidoglycan/xylan/chitin deacetylase (PgdA/CDA1 family)
VSTHHWLGPLTKNGPNIDEVSPVEVVNQDVAESAHARPKCLYAFSTMQIHHTGPGAHALRRGLRDVPIVRSAAIRLITLARGSRNPGDGILFLYYHDVGASDLRAFERQLTRLRDLGDFIGIEDATGASKSGGRYICLTFDDGCLGAFEHAFPIVAAREIPAAFFVVTGWIDDGRPGTMSWDDCRRLVDCGMTIGSHSRTHRRLASLNPLEAREEFTVSRARIEAETKQSCRHFACPWGQPAVDYQPRRDPELARAAGYQTFFTTVQCRVPAGVSPFEVPRIRMEPAWGAAEVKYAFSRPRMDNA